MPCHAMPCHSLVLAGGEQQHGPRCTSKVVAERKGRQTRALPVGFGYKAGLDLRRENDQRSASAVVSKRHGTPPRGAEYCEYRMS
jgi:hypothetical protein